MYFRSLSKHIPVHCLLFCVYSSSHTNFYFKEKSKTIVLDLSRHFFVIAVVLLLTVVNLLYHEAAFQINIEKKYSNSIDWEYIEGWCLHITVWLEQRPEEALHVLGG